MTTVNLALIEQLQEFETPLVAESLAALGCTETERYYIGMDIRLLTSVTQPMVGVAMTLEADTSSPQTKPDAGPLYEAYEQMERMAVPVVMVVKTVGSRPGHECVLGDGIAKTALTVGCCGVVTDGGARDLDGISSLGFSVFGKGAVVDHATLVYRKAAESVQISGIEVHDGDLIHADHNGVHLVPAAYHDAIIEACFLSRDFETRAHAFFRRTDKSTEEKRRHVEELNEHRKAACNKLMASASP